MIFTNNTNSLLRPLSRELGHCPAVWTVPLAEVRFRFQLEAIKVKPYHFTTLVLFTVAVNIFISYH